MAHGKVEHVMVMVLVLLTIAVVFTARLERSSRPRLQPLRLRDRALRR